MLYTNIYVQYLYISYPNLVFQYNNIYDDADIGDDDKDDDDADEDDNYTDGADVIEDDMCIHVDWVYSK